MKKILFAFLILTCLFSCNDLKAQYSLLIPSADDTLTNADTTYAIQQIKGDGQVTIFAGLKRVSGTVAGTAKLYVSNTSATSDYKLWSATDTLVGSTATSTADALQYWVIGGSSTYSSHPYVWYKIMWITTGTSVTIPRANYIIRASR